MIILPDEAPAVKPYTPRQWADDHGEPLTIEQAPEPDDIDMNVIDALDVYTEAYLDVLDFRADCAQLLAELTQLERRLARAEADLKTYARQRGEMANDTISVIVSYPVSRTWDVACLLDRDSRIADIPGIIVTTRTVDSKKLDGLVRLGIVDGERIAPALREEPLTPRVTIKAVTKHNEGEV